MVILVYCSTQEHCPSWVSVLISSIKSVWELGCFYNVLFQNTFIAQLKWRIVIIPSDQCIDIEYCWAVGVSCWWKINPNQVFKRALCSFGIEIQKHIFYPSIQGSVYPSRDWYIPLCSNWHTFCHFLVSVLLSLTVILSEDTENIPTEFLSSLDLRVKVHVVNYIIGLLKIMIWLKGIPKSQMLKLI